MASNSSGFLALYNPYTMPSLSDNTTIWQAYCNNHSRSNICLDYINNYYEYRIELAPNIVFLAIYSISMTCFLATYAFTRRGLVFNFALAMGCACEMAGYIGRIISWQNQWNMNGFLIQIVCLTIGPAFMAAGIYLCLRRIVEIYGIENSHVAPQWYTNFFIPCDLLALTLQAAGGAWAAIALGDNENIDPGTNIMVGGLGVQVFTGTAFCVAGIAFIMRLRKRIRLLGPEAALNQNPADVAVRSTWYWKYFLLTLAVSAVMIVWRSSFRTAELSDGWSGPVTRYQGLFIGFEGVLISVVCVGLNIMNPSWCIGERLDGKGIKCFGGRKKAAATRERSDTKTSYSSGYPMTDV
ncbi:hypothetical protein TD95_004328 [Thielaviopsis punctulata]|uniref:RTA1 domain protein n=1 Tax=Thielaviopsis punctulata TaxID=72032 RepID=A0A0F4ZII1_9PEZI|nr:hypothetical protein TD95_004328 [Thielaviopsis punctulata]